jgi:hypothetical protein
MGIYLIHYTHLIVDPNINPDLGEIPPPIFKGPVVPNPDPNSEPDEDPNSEEDEDPNSEEDEDPNSDEDDDPNSERQVHPDTSNTGANSHTNSHARKTVLNAPNSAGRRRLTGRAYRERKKRAQLRNDIGPKLKIQKVLPLNRDNTGHPLRRRTQQSSYLYSTNLTLLANALREIKHYQKQVGLVFARSSFNRLVKQICEDDLRTPLRWQASALAALQYSAETALGMHFEMLYTPILHPC